MVTRSSPAEDEALLGGGGTACGDDLVSVFTSLDSVKMTFFKKQLVDY